MLLLLYERFSVDYRVQLILPPQGMMWKKHLLRLGIKQFYPLFTLKTQG